MKRTFLYRQSPLALVTQRNAEQFVERDLLEEAVYHKSHTNCTGIESGPPGQEYCE
jgi:hypothetical protein